MSEHSSRKGSHTLDTAAARYNALASAAAGELIGAVESLSVIWLFDQGKILHGTAEFRESSRVPVRIRRWVDSLQGAAALKTVGAIGATVTLSARRSRRRQIVGAALTYASTVVTEWRSPYGRDGADQMAGIVNGYRLLTAVVPDPVQSDDLFLRAVSIQALVAYFSSGLAKAISSSWMSGNAVEDILKTKMYGQSLPARRLSSRNRLCKVITWSTIVGECAFPLVRIVPSKVVNAMLMAAKVFHLGIAITMGLPRFFWGFNASHYAIRYVRNS